MRDGILTLYIVPSAGEEEEGRMRESEGKNGGEGESARGREMEGKRGRE